MDFRKACGRCYHQGRRAAEAGDEAAIQDVRDQAKLEVQEYGSMTAPSQAFLDGVAHARQGIPPIVDQDGRRILDESA